VTQGNPGRTHRHGHRQRRANPQPAGGHRHPDLQPGRPGAAVTQRARPAWFWGPMMGYARLRRQRSSKPPIASWC
jgi:hypothetical protein